MNDPDDTSAVEDPNDGSQQVAEDDVEALLKGSRVLEQVVNEIVINTDIG